MSFVDAKRIGRLGKYLRRDRKRLVLIIIILLPVAFAGAIQPFLVGQAISILRDDDTSLEFFKGFTEASSISAIAAKW